MRADDDECALFHALYPVTGGAVTDAPRVTLVAGPHTEPRGSVRPVRPVRTVRTVRPVTGPGRPVGGGGTEFGMYLFGHWIADARVCGPRVDITFDTHSHEVAELLGTQPTRLASLLALVLARCPDVARAARGHQDSEDGVREGREGREARKGILTREGREAKESVESVESVESNTDEELVMLTDLTTSGQYALTSLTALAGLAHTRVVAFFPNGADCPNGADGTTKAPNGASIKWARVVSWDTESLALLAFHVDVRNYFMLPKRRFPGVHRGPLERQNK